MFDQVELWDWIFTFLNVEDRKYFLQAGFKSLIQNKFQAVTRHCSEEQKQAIYAICFQTANQMILGKPGTGKTFIVLLSFSFLSWLGLNYKTAAYTGVAAINCEGSTLHSLFPFYKLKNNWFEEKECPCYNTNLAVHKQLYETHILFVDEVSMIDPVTYEQFRYMLQTEKCSCKLVFVGDFRQLPPVKSQSKNRQYFFESSKLYQLQVFQLTKVYRQKDNLLIDVINAIGENRFTMDILRFFKERTDKYSQLTEDQKFDIPHLFHKNVDVDEWNQKCFHSLTSPITTSKYTIHSMVKMEVEAGPGCQMRCLSQKVTTPPDNDILRGIDDAGVRDIDIRAGMNIMFTKNIFHYPVTPNRETFLNPQDDKNEKIHLANGTQGKILQVISPTEVIIQVGKKQFYFCHCKKDLDLPGRSDKFIKRFTKVSLSYFPFVLSYALTIHKCQGLTLKKAVMSLKRLPNTELMYVAVSRVVSSNNLYVIDFSVPIRRIDCRVEEYLKHIPTLPDSFYQAFQKFCSVSLLSSSSKKQKCLQ